MYIIEVQSEQHQHTMESCDSLRCRECLLPGGTGVRSEESIHHGKFASKPSDDRQAVWRKSIHSRRGLLRI
jgi:hypothetical protein